MGASPPSLIFSSASAAAAPAKTKSDEKNPRLPFAATAGFSIFEKSEEFFETRTEAGESDLFESGFAAGSDAGFVAADFPESDPPFLHE